MSDSKTVCPSGHHHLNDESLSLEEVTSGEEVYRTNAFACYKPYNSTSLHVEESSAIMCRTEEGVNVNVYGWYVCLQQESTSPWPLAVLLIAFFALLFGLLYCFLKKRNQEGREISQV